MLTKLTQTHFTSCVSNKVLPQLGEVREKNFTHPLYGGDSIIRAVSPWEAPGNWVLGVCRYDRNSQISQLIQPERQREKRQEEKKTPGVGQLTGLKHTNSSGFARYFTFSNRCQITYTAWRVTSRSRTHQTQQIYSGQQNSKESYQGCMEIKLELEKL